MLGMKQKLVEEILEHLDESQCRDLMARVEAAKKAEAGSEEPEAFEKPEGAEGLEIDAESDLEDAPIVPEEGLPEAAEGEAKPEGSDMTDDEFEELLKKHLG